VEFNFVELGALMPPNLCGKLEDVVAMCVLSGSFLLVNSLFVLIQTQLILYLFENMCFLKGCEISTC